MVQMRCPSSLASLKTASCLCKTAQTWREKPANSSDMTCFSGKSLRYGEKIRLHGGAISSTLQSPPEKCKESVFWIQILCRNQANPQILWCYQAKVTESLQKSGALDVSLAIQMQFSKRRTSRLAHHTRSSARSGARSSVRPDMLLNAQHMQQNHLLTCNF